MQTIRFYLAVWAMEFGFWLLPHGRAKAELKEILTAWRVHIERVNSGLSSKVTIEITD